MTFDIFEITHEKNSDNKMSPVLDMKLKEVGRSVYGSLIMVFENNGVEISVCVSPTPMGGVNIQTKGVDNES